MPHTYTPFRKTEAVSRIVPMLVGTFITWTESDTTSMLGYVADLISDLQPLLIPIIAIGIGLIVVGAIISAIRGHS